MSDTTSARPTQVHLYQVATADPSSSLLQKTSPSFFFQITRMVVRSVYPLPEFADRAGRGVYGRYCPNIEAIERGICDGRNRAYTIFIAGDADTYEILGQLENLAAFYASECDTPEFDNAENLTPCA